MAEEGKKSISEKLKEVYRLSIVDLDTLKEVRSYTLSLRNYLTLLFFFVLFILLIYTLFIAFTPVKKLIPGYGDIEENRQFVELRKKLIDLEEEVESQRIYNDGLRKLLQGESLNEYELEKVENFEKDTSPEVISSAEMKETRFARTLDNMYFVPPVYGTISSPFDLSIEHYGIDILAPKDTPIKAIARGVVINSGWSIDSGNSITIQHSNNIITSYKHNSTLLKEVGDYVNAGEAIAVIGSTGTLSSGPHLHFELWFDGVAVNPENYISFQ